MGAYGRSPTTGGLLMIVPKHNPKVSRLLLIIAQAFSGKGCFGGRQEQFPDAIDMARWPMEGASVGQILHKPLAADHPECAFA